MNLEAALKDTEQAIAAKKREIDGLAEEIQLLEMEHRGLELALARHRGSAPPSDLPVTERSWWVEAARTDAVLRVVREAERPLSPTAVASVLAKTGRTGDDANYCAAALSYLRKQKKVRSVGRGQWLAARPPTAPPADQNTAAQNTGVVTAPKEQAYTPPVRDVPPQSDVNGSLAAPAEGVTA